VFINVGVFDHRWSDQKPRSDESPLKRDSKRRANISAEQKGNLVRTSRRDFMKLLTWNGIALFALADDPIGKPASSMAIR
jgi:hypothetical protein